ncbi:TPA: DUF4391 domain-containing protein [Vibrio parahaemolyticus]|uniref:DUF4391 domain-containing protein n=1 Tax=Vibrio parahaemolyticus TaxID=670 RepID=UPI001B81EF6A|nr:DUF4391 domain-containing protein [Vibrio parahaemolyticus]MEA5299004.1 DUF4391 domain-containing protein [Vibrio parahaemolyticus]HBC3440380.1 DUF4391 domain-containing protein [Vibrio parahaemolyticus]
MNDVIDFSCGNLLDKVYEHLALPDSTFLGTRITKKMILENNDLSSSDKKLVNDVIQSVEWVNTLKPETLNIPTYVTETVEYIEVAVLKVSIKDHPTNQGKLKPSLIKKVAKLFHTVIPYPVILLLELNGEVAICLADKRINQADSSKLVIEHVYNSPWFNIGTLKNNENEFLSDFSLKNVSRVNYYELYQDFISKLIALETSYISDNYQKNDIPNRALLSSHKSSGDKYEEPLFQDRSNEEKTRLLEELASLEGELSNIRNKLKKEVQMNEKMRLNVQARKVKQAISAITSQLSA